MVSAAVKVFVIAGEPSGDKIGAEVLSSLFARNGIEVRGIGGRAMEACGGFKSLFPIRQIAVMSMKDIIFRIFKLKALIKQTCEELVAFEPDILITVDSPGFNRRVAAFARQKFGKKVILVHCVAPSVWAYKPKRAKQYAQLFDKLYCILPFEPQYFNPHGLDAEYLCYPPLRRLWRDIDQATQAKTSFDKRGNIYIMLSLGSRVSEVKMNLKMGLYFVKEIKKRYKAVFVIPTLEHILEEVDLRKHFEQEIIITSEEDRIKYLQIVDFAFCKSGTNATEASLFYIPSVVFYKLDFVTFLFSLVYFAFSTFKRFSIINIINDNGYIPEFIGPRCKKRDILNAMVNIIDDPNLPQLQRYWIQQSMLALEKKAQPGLFGDIVVRKLFGDT